MTNCTGVRCPMQYDKVDPATCPCVEYCPNATPPLTHGDLVRSMNNDELCEWYLWMLQYVQGFTDSRIALREWMSKEIDRLEG